MASDSKSVAVTGMSCRFPGDADSIESFWEVICAGRSAYSETTDRWSVDAFHHPTKKPNTSITRGAHYLKQDIATWDANFFGISKAEAESVDPQQRIMIEVAYEAMENAGLPMHKMAGTRTGVYIGSFTSDYRELVHRDPEAAPPYTLTGTSNTSTSNRISWFFDLKGPSFTMNTACSSSLVALHLACQSLRTGETDYAIVGGASLLLNPDIFMFLSNQGFLAADGKCKSFDASGDGYGRGDGFAAVILRRADDAIRDGDPLRAVVRMTGSNQDGRTKGFTLPSADAQANLTRETYRNAGLAFEDTTYIEAHGTGTKAGDSGETKGLADTIAAAHSPLQPLLIGSVKSNIGHLEGCAGLAGFIKAILVVENALIPPTIHLKELNPTIPWDEYNIEVPTQLTPWPVEGVRRVSTQGFGYGGTNAHAIIDDAQSYLEHRALDGHHYTKPIATSGSLLNGHPTPDPRPRLFMLSAQDKDGIPRVKRTLAEHIRRKSNDPDEQSYLPRLAFTLNEKRSKLQWSTYAVAFSLEELSESLANPDATALQTRAMTHEPRIGFVFTGQGAQWPRMGQSLMAYHAFRSSVGAADRYLRSLGCTWSALEELANSEALSNVHGAEYSQTLCTVLQVALVDLAKSWNIVPQAVGGHSSGEIAAAYCLGALSAESAWKIAYYRGVLSAQLKDLAPELQGAMLAIGSSQAQAEEYISAVSKGEVNVACINSPSSVTVSGDAAGIDQLEQILKEKGVFARKLKTDDCAYHSEHMQAIARLYLELIADVEILPDNGSGCKMHSSVVGGVVDNEDLGPVSWVRNLTAPVLFADAVKDMVRPGKATENSLDIVVEVGPHSALQGAVTQTLKHHMITGVQYFPLLSRGKNDAESMLACAGALRALGSPVNLCQANDETDAAFKPVVDLPSYPWNRSLRFWSETRMGKQYRTRNRPPSPLIGAPYPTLCEGEHIWRGFFNSAEEPWIKDHSIQGQVLYPAAGFLAMAIEAVLQISDHGKTVSGVKIREVQVISALIVPDEGTAEMIVQLRPHHVGTRASSFDWYEFTVSSSTDDQDLRQNSVGLIAVEYEPVAGSLALKELDSEATQAVRSYSDAEASCTTEFDPSDFYNKISAHGLQYGPVFAKLTKVQCGPQISSCQLTLTETPHEFSKAERPWLVHPATLDAAFHLSFAAMLNDDKTLRGAMVPTRIDEVTIATSLPYQAGAPLKGHASVRSHGMREMIADISMLNETATEPVIRIAGLHLADVSGGDASAKEEDSSKKLCFESIWRPVPDLLSTEDLQRIMTGPWKLENALQSSGTSSDEEKPFHMVYESMTGAQNLADRICEYVQMQDHRARGQDDLSILEIETASQDVPPVALLPLSNTFTELSDAFEYTLVTATQDRLDILDKRFEGRSLATRGRIVNMCTEDAHETFGEQKFDLIVIVDIGLGDFDATTAIAKSKHLLNSNGRICVVETSRPGAQLGLAMSAHHTKQERDWRSALAASNLETEVHVHDVEDKTSQQLCMTLLRQVPAAEALESNLPQQIVLIEPLETSGHAAAIVDYLVDLLSRNSVGVERVKWSCAAPGRIEGKICISFLEVGQPFLANLSQDDFEAFQQLLLRCGEMLWVNKIDDPASSLVEGLFRSVRNEIAGAKFRSLQLEATSTSLTAAEMICKVLGYGGSDDEFRVIDGSICSSRIQEASLEDKAIRSLLPDTKQEPVLIKRSDVPAQLKLAVRTPGVLDSICFEVDAIPDEPLEPGQVEIAVQGSSMNFREVMVALGQIPDDKLGFDCAGYIHRVAADVIKVKVGDRVAAMSHGAHRTMHRVQAGLCEAIPDSMSFEEASTVPVVAGTAWYGLVKLAQVQPGQSVLIHAAAGGVGQSAIMLAKYLKQEIFATVSSEEKRALLRSRYDIPDDHIFNSRDLSFAKGIKRMTNGRGVDTILNSLSGEALRQSFWCLAPFGTFLEIGIKDILNNSSLEMAPFRQDITFSFFDLNHIAMRKPELMSEVLENVFDLIRRGITQPVSPLTVYSASEVETAFRQMQTGKHIGKIAIKYLDDDVLPVVASAIQQRALDPEAAYLMVGGLGGAGRSLATLLVRLGARKLCILSRRGSKSAHAAGHIQKLAALGVRAVIYECDVGDEASLRETVERCAVELGPVKGVIQGAMSLQDSLFEKMTYEQWTKSLRPKVNGTRNLHKVLPQDMDFFVILSSFAGIFGNRGQCNYAAAGAFQDAMATLRPEAVAIDLGILRDVGVLAEGGITDNLRAWEVPFGIREKELHALVERAITANDQIPKQLMTGFATTATAQAAGIDTPFYLESDARFRKLARSSESSADSQTALSTSISTAARLSAASSLSGASEIICEAIASRIAKILQTPVSEIDTSRPLHAYGIDSLVAVELGHWVHKELQSSATVFDLMSSSPISALAKRIAAKSTAVPKDLC